METATQHLTKHGIRPSVQRVAIMKYLMEHITHPTVDTIYSDLHESMPTLSRTTVYNTLELLRQSSAAKALCIDKRTMHYDGRLDPHAHFMCRCCGQITDVEVDEHLRGHLYHNPNFSIEQVELNYTGVCKQCQAKDKN